MRFVFLISSLLLCLELLHFSLPVHPHELGLLIWQRNSKKKASLHATTCPLDRDVPPAVRGRSGGGKLRVSSTVGVGADDACCRDADEDEEMEEGGEW